MFSRSKQRPPMEGKKVTTTFYVYQKNGSVTTIEKVSSPIFLSALGGTVIEGKKAQWCDQIKAGFWWDPLAEAHLPASDILYVHEKVEEEIITEE